eukprot:1595490-Pyramimonas_sp.AAC.1
MQYFRCPTVMGPGKAAQLGVHPNFDCHTGDLIKTMQSRGVTVLPSDHWIDACDRVAPQAWHSKQNNDNLAMFATQFCHAVCYRNFCALIQSLPSQLNPFRPPILTPVTDTQAYTQAEEIMEALQFREKMTNEWKRDLSRTTLMTQTAGEMALCLDGILRQ